MTASPERSGRSGDVTITVCPHGPLLVQGPAVLEDEAGNPVAHTRNVLALCRCGRSGRKPLCDGSHRQSRFRDDSSSDTIAAALATGANRDRVPSGRAVPERPPAHPPAPPAEPDPHGPPA